MVQGNLWWTSTGTYWNLIQDQPIYIMVHPYTMFSRRCYWYVLVMDVHDVSAPPRHGHLVAAPLPSTPRWKKGKMMRKWADDTAILTEIFRNIWKYLLYLLWMFLGYSCPSSKGDVESQSVDEQELEIWTFQTPEEACWQSYLAARNPETLEGLSDNFLFVLSIQLHTQKNDIDIDCNISSHVGMKGRHVWRINKI